MNFVAGENKGNSELSIKMFVETFSMRLMWQTGQLCMLLLGFTTLFDILGHQRRFRHRA